MAHSNSPLRWNGWGLGKIGLGVFVFVVAVFSWGLRNASEPYGAMAAMYAMCAASMLFITSLPTKNAKMDSLLNPALRFASIILAFLSGGFWVRSELGEDTGPYLVLLTIAGAGLSIAAVIWLLMATAIYNTLRERLRDRSR